MAIEVEDLTTLDDDLVTQAREELATRLQEFDPSNDYQRGVLHDLLLHFSAILAALNQTNTDRIRQSNSLDAIEKDPTLADDDTVDLLASNYRIERLPGQTATGGMTIVVSTLATVTIGAGEIYEANGVQFAPQQAYVARTSASAVQSSSDRVLTQLADGNWAFTIDVTAIESGETGNIVKDTLLVPETQPANFVKAYAAEDFSGGADVETNETLLARMQEGIAAKALSNRVNMNASLREQAAFANIVATSIVGFGDAEMIRDRHAIWPMSLGGRVDWYVRSSARPQSFGMTLEATLVEKTIDNRGVWQFALGKDAAPGFYEIKSVLQTGADATSGSYELTSDVRSIDLTGDDDFLPDVATTAEGAFSRYQAGVFKFLDTHTDTTALSVGAVRDYDVTVIGMPLIGDMQDYVAGRQVRNYAGDVLVKAPVPCFVQLTFRIQQKAGAEPPDLDAIKNDLAAVVNGVSFTGRLPASLLSDTVHNRLTGDSALTNIDMFGRIRTPANATQYIRSDETLIVPDDADGMVTARTVAFYLEPEDIAVSVETVAIPEL